MKFKIGDRVEVLSPEEMVGLIGTVTEVSGKGDLYPFEYFKVSLDQPYQTKFRLLTEIHRADSELRKSKQWEIMTSKNGALGYIRSGSDQIAVVEMSQAKKLVEALNKSLDN